MDAAHEFLGNEEEVELCIGNVLRLVGRYLDNIARDRHHDGAGPHVEGVQVVIYLEVTFFQKKEDIPVKADRVLQHFEDALAFFHLFSMNFSQDDILAQDVLVNHRSQGQNALDVNGL